MSSPDFVPVNTPLLDGRERALLVQCIETGWISSEGPFVAAFEEAFSARVGRRFGIAVCNGSAALEAAVAALRLGPGDEVILPTFTIISCAAPIVRSGAQPILVDSDRVNWNMDLSQVEARITPRTRAIMAVHTYGLPIDMRRLSAIAERHGLVIIEDAAEMHGQTCDGRPCGSFGDLSIFSFYPNKHITTGEGGMIVTDDPELAERCRSLRNLCFQPKRRFTHDELGWNFRMTNLQAALGLAQLERLDQFVARKRAMGRLYRKLLEDLSAIEMPPAQLEWAENIWWVFGIVLADKVPFAADEAMHKLAAERIGTRPFFWPMHKQPVFQKMGLFPGETYPTAERLALRGFYLPSGVGLTESQIHQSAAALKKILE